jgi:hypothetical protein
VTRNYFGSALVLLPLIEEEGAIVLVDIRADN